MSQIFTAYAITFGWAIVASISVGIGIAIALRLFDWSTSKIDEWEELKKGNIAVAILLGSIVLAIGHVIAVAIQP